jgi:phosphatidylglycerophosphatase A
MFLYKTIASFFGIGYIGKGSGTVAALVISILLYISIRVNVYTDKRALVLSFVVFFIGVISATQAEKIWEKDSKRIVIDEVFGMMVSVLFLPLSFSLIGSGFVLFRFFDIYKPFGIRKAELLPAGWGVMVDDLLAGIYANIVLQGFCLLRYNI